MNNTHRIRLGMLGAALAGSLVAGTVPALTAPALAVPKSDSGCANADSNEAKAYARYVQAMMDELPHATIMARQATWQRAFDKKNECAKIPAADSGTCVPRVRGVGSTRKGNGCDD